MELLLTGQITDEMAVTLASGFEPLVEVLTALATPEVRIVHLIERLVAKKSTS